VFGSEWLTGALLDRLTHHVHILEMNGDSYRLKQSKPLVTPGDEATELRRTSAAPMQHCWPRRYPLSPLMRISGAFRWKLWTVLFNILVWWSHLIAYGSFWVRFAMT
jgi:hypothetical protein